MLFEFASVRTRVDVNSCFLSSAYPSCTPLASIDHYNHPPPSWIVILPTRPSIPLSVFSFPLASLSTQSIASSLSPSLSQDMTCLWCRQVGHAAAQCPQNKDSGKLKCFNCGSEVCVVIHWGVLLSISCCLVPGPCPPLRSLCTVLSCSGSTYHRTLLHTCLSRHRHVFLPDSDSASTCVCEEVCLQD